MAREDSRTKGLRMLTEGRVTVRHVDDHTVVAKCRGDSARVYALGYDRGRWWCSCPCLTPECGHLKALRLIVLEPEHGRGTTAATRP